MMVPPADRAVHLIVIANMHPPMLVSGEIIPCFPTFFLDGKIRFGDF